MSSSVDEPASLSARRAASSSTRMPSRIAPMLAQEAPEPFDSRDHIFELMWGGLRAMAYVRDGVVRLIGRNGRDLTPSFPELSLIPGMLNAYEAILDGEIIVVDAQGHPSFDALRPRLQAMALPTAQEPPLEFTKPKKITGQVCFQAFDLLWLDGRSLTEKTLWQRKNRLHDVARASAEFAAVDFVDDEGVAFFDAVLQRRLEGIVAKKKVSEYTPGRRSPDWLAVRALQSADFVVGGYTFGGTRRKGEPFSQLLLGGYSEGRFEYVGAVSGGLTDAEAKQLISLLEPLVIDAPAFDDPPPIARLIYWTEPKVVCHVRFSEWARDGHLRFPIFSALRPDLDPRDCQLD
jgi:bifunctional non-homologous end joining protein LigD